MAEHKNEVFQSCPKCKFTGYYKIDYIVPGYGGFNLDNVESLKKRLNQVEFIDLENKIKGSSILCKACQKQFDLKISQ